MEIFPSLMEEANCLYLNNFPKYECELYSKQPFDIQCKIHVAIYTLHHRLSIESRRWSTSLSLDIIRSCHFCSYNTITKSLRMHMKSLFQLDHQVNINSISQRLPRSVTLGNQLIWHHSDILLVPQAPWLPRFWNQFHFIGQYANLGRFAYFFQHHKKITKNQALFPPYLHKIEVAPIIGVMKPHMNNITRFHPKRLHPSKWTIFMVVWDVYDNFTHQKVSEYSMFI